MKSGLGRVEKLPKRTPGEIGCVWAATKMIHHRQVNLHALFLLLGFFWFGTIVQIAWVSDESPVATLPAEEFPPTLSSPTFEPILMKTEIVTLPLIEQNSGGVFLTPVVDSSILQETPVPGSPGPSPTPTSTPLPPQTGATNLPIVIGAAAIYLIIILAWLLVGWRPKRSDDL